LRQQRVLARGWRIRQVDPCDRLPEAEIQSVTRQGDWLEAPDMPRQVHEILLHHGRLPEELAIGLAHDSKWVAETDWLYACDFEAPGPGQKVLRFAGLDTLADIYVNGRHVASHEDMFLPAAVDITDIVRPLNSLLVHFHSPYARIERLSLPAEWQGKVAPAKLLRKCNTDFGDYLGAKPYLTPIGIFDQVTLDVVDAGCIAESDLSARLERGASRGLLAARFAGECVGDAVLRLSVLDPDGGLVHKADKPLVRTARAWRVDFDVVVEAPRLWWPRGYGDQPLYTVRAELLVAGSCADTVEKRVGWREIEIQSYFDVSVNGTKVKCWGANFAPPLGITHVWDDARAATLLDLVENANMNTLRIWGQGCPYGEQLYDEADRRGLLLWQEFYHGYGMQPDTREFRALCRREAEHMVRRLKHHPSVFMWCGGNEGYMGGDFDHPGQPHIGAEVYVEDYPEVCARLDPDRFYIPNSPWGGAYTNNPAIGDCHGYNTWWFIPGNECPAMYSEHIRTSPPVLRSLQRFIKSEDLWPAGYVNQHRYGDRCPMPDTWMARTSAAMEKKTGPIEQYYDARNPEELVYRFGAAHAQEMREGIERCRIGRTPEDRIDGRKCFGHLVWKLNDTWPMIYCGIVDAFLEAYMPYYAVKRAYAPVLACLDIRDHIYAWVVNDSPEPVRGVLEARLFDITKNNFGDSCRAQVLVPPGQSHMGMTLDAFGQFRRINLVQVTLADEAGRPLSRSVYQVDIERHMAFPEARLDVSISGRELTIRTDRFARCVELSGDDHGDEFGWFFDDNYFDLLPGEERKVRILGRHGQGTIKARAHYSPSEAVVSFAD
jgi:beta-mannosidase